MSSSISRTIPGVIAALLSVGVTVGAEVPAPLVDTKPRAATPSRPVMPRKIVDRAAPMIPAPEPAVADTANAGFASASAFAATGVTANAQTLSPPVTVSYNGSAAALLVTDTGTGKAIQATINNTANTSSALYGSTNGAGAGLTGYNSGTKGPAGKFGVTSPASEQPAVFATTAGFGPAVLGTVTVNSTQSFPAIYGQNISTPLGGIGVRGDGNAGGVYGVSEATGVEGASTNGTGVYGYSDNGLGVAGYSVTTYGVAGTSETTYGGYFESQSGSGLYANSITSGDGIDAHTASGTGISAVSDAGDGVSGQSTNGRGVVGLDSGNGIGVYGSSATGYAGYFQGKVAATEYDTLSDRNAKTDIHAVDGGEILARVREMPVSHWKFKADAAGEAHLGPMAQDFHAAFGLGGDDDKHIDLADAAGVSLAAIQELGHQMEQKDRQLSEKDAQIAALERKVNVLEASFAARLAALERREVTDAQTRDRYSNPATTAANNSR